MILYIGIYNTITIDIMEVITMESIWQQRVKDATEQTIKGSILAGFNTNVDAVVHCNGVNVEKLFEDPEVSLAKVNSLDVEQIHTIKEKNEFVAILKDCLGKGKSFYIILENMDLLDWLEQSFANRQELMGGQAGIIANQMAALNARSMVYTALLSQHQASMFFPEVLYPVCNGKLDLVPVQKASRKNDPIKINWIFEYGKDIEFNFGGEKIVTPRANRVILATRPPGAVMSFVGDVAEHLTELGSKIDVAFMAGYHYATTEQPDFESYLADITDSIAKLKSGNKHIRLHYEYVPMKDEQAEKRILTTVGNQFQSFGINENEIQRVLKGFGFISEIEQIDQDERAFSLYQGAKRLMEQLNFSRIQVHNLGYYVVILKKPYPVDPQRVRQSCLFGSAVNAIKAKYGGYVKRQQIAEVKNFKLSDIGYQQLKSFYQEALSHGLDINEDFCEQGILECDDHYLLVVPAHVIPNPVSTVGMGDTISSSSYACEYTGIFAEC